MVDISADRLLRLGWTYGRNKKGYCDGHERLDVVQYREQIFCPRMKVSSASSTAVTVLTSSTDDLSNPTGV